MSTPNLKHIIGKDGLHRLRLTAANGEIIDNSHEGFSSKAEAWDNLTRKLRVYLNLGLMRVAIPEHITEVGWFPTVDERDFHIGATGKTESLAISLGLLPDRDGNVLPCSASDIGGDAFEPQTPET